MCILTQIKTLQIHSTDEEFVIQEALAALLAKKNVLAKCFNNISKGRQKNTQRLQQPGILKNRSSPLKCNENRITFF